MKEKEMTALNLWLAILGCSLFSVSLHYRKPDKPLEYGYRLGFAKNLTTGGRIMLFAALLAFILAFVL